MRNIAIKLTDLLISWELVDKKYRARCRYLIERKLLSFIGYSAIFITGIYTDHILETCCFAFSFIFLRQRTGGYHANHILICLCASTGLAVIVPTVISFINSLNIIIQISVIVSSFIVIFIFAPVNHPNMHMTATEQQANKKLAIKNLSILALLYIVLRSTELINLSSGIIYGIFATSISIVIAKFLGQEEI